jgi:hypothetical protein
VMAGGAFAALTVDASTAQVKIDSLHVTVL